LRPRRPAITVLAVMLMAAVASPAPAEERGEPEEAPLRTVFVPQLGYTPELGWLFGAAVLALYDPIGPGPVSSTVPPGPDTAATVELSSRPVNTLMLSGFYTTSAAYTLTVTNTQYVLRDRLLLDSRFAFAEIPSDFFGIGSDAAAKETYVDREVSGELGTLFEMYPRLRVGPRFRATRYWVSDPDEGGILDSEDEPGSDGAVVLLPTLELRYDSRRPAAFDPRSGSAFTLQLARSLPASSESFGRLSAEYLQITPFFGEHRVATQYLLEHVFDTVPFQELPRLGGASLLRGISEGRYRDRSLVAAQAEYRSPYLRRFGLEVFGGVGQVAPQLDELDGDELVAAGGAGLRFLLDPDSGFVVRFNAAYSEAEGSPQFYVGAGDAF